MKREEKMRFLFTQILIVILVCIFFTALSDLSELGITGWLITGASGYVLYRIYKQINYNFKSYKRRNASGLSSTLESYMFADVTGVNMRRTRQREE